MLTRRHRNYVPFVLCTMGLALLFLAGCRKEEPALPPSSPANYMHDKKFVGALAAGRAEQSRLIRSRNEIARQMAAMIEAKKAAMKTEDLKLVKAELEKDAAWCELYAQCTNANAQVARQRQELLGQVRERLAPEKKGISK